MAEATQKDAEKKPLPGSPGARESGRRNLNSQIAQRQKMLLAGIGAIALIGGGMFIFGGDSDEGGTDANGAATIDTGGLVNRNLSQREFVASYGNRLDAQGRAIKDLQQTQLPRSDTVSGVGTNDSIGTAFSEVDNASRTLQQQFGLSRRASDDITISWFLNGDAGAGAKAEGGVLNAQAGVRGGRNQAWTDSDIGIASEDRGRIMGTLRQLSDSRNWSNTRESFLRETSSSSVSQVSTNSSGLSRSLTEAESYTREARRAEEMASRLENQASWYEANSAAGTLNLSQAYREWGMAEMEANRDYYGPVRFDDIQFQMSARGQQLQSRFVESYADRLQDDIEADLSLPDFAPVSRPGIGSAGQVRARGDVGSAGGPSMPDAPDRSDITDEVERVRRQGGGRIGTVRTFLDRQTEGATGASEEAADDVKEWGNR